MNTENLDLGWRLRDGRMSEMTREEAIKWLEEAVNDTNNDFDLCSDALKKELLLQKDVFEMAISALKNTHGEWISVKDRLPDKPGHYLVCTSINYWHGGCMDKNEEHK